MSLLTLNTYGLSQMSMDWFGLSDPFQENLYLKATNNWSGTIYLQAQLVTPPVWYSAYSGINLGSILAGSNASPLMTWAISVSGTALQTSSPTDDTLTLRVAAYSVSGFASSGLIASAAITFTNVLFSRYSGVIKVQGDIYNGDVPTTSAALASGGSLVSGSTYTYALTYNQSGWESDRGTVAALTTTSGKTSASLTWNPPTAAVTQFFVYRASGSIGDGLYDLIAVTSGGAISYLDNGGAALTAGIYRKFGWDADPALGGNIWGNRIDTGIYLSPPASLDANTGTVVGTQAFLSKPVFISKNISGVTLLGPLYYVFHIRTFANPMPNGISVSYLTNSGEFISGVQVADSSTLPTISGSWTRYCIYLSGYNGSGLNYLQLHYLTRQQATNPNTQIDDVFLVAQS